MNTIWEAIATHLSPSTAEINAARELVQAYQAKGAIEETLDVLLLKSDATMAQFYVELAAQGATTHSPVAHYKDSAWMTQSDFCFLNIRATAIGARPGTFVQAAKILPGIRAAAIHLAPFTYYDFGILYAVSSVQSIAPQLLDDDLQGAGFGAEAQLQALVEAAHLLGKAIGFDVEPHVTQFAIPVLMQPELFRWIKLYAPDKRWLDYLQSTEQQLRPENQERITAIVRGMVQSALKEAGLKTLEAEPEDSEERLNHKSIVYHRLVKGLIDEGFWTLLVHMWSGVGVPEYRHYNPRHFPEFTYINMAGLESGDRSYGVVTPYKFYDKVPPNRRPDHQPPRNEAAIDFYANIFSHWRDVFGFDFVRYDSVDHIFDSIVENHHDYPAADRPTPAVLQQAVHSSRTAKPYIGNLAERMGNEWNDYAAIGFDAMLGNDMFEPIDQHHMEKSFALYEQLSALNKHRLTPFAITYAIDTHDTADPHLMGMSMLAASGSRGVLQRLFVARMLNIGLGRRPKYETMGTQDMSDGLYEANVQPVGLRWGKNAEHNASYHAIERFYQQQRPWLDTGCIRDHSLFSTYAWWLIEAEGRYFLPVIAWAKSEIRLDLHAHLPPKAEISIYHFDHQAEVVRVDVADTWQAEVGADFFAVFVAKLPN